MANTTSTHPAPDLAGSDPAAGVLARVRAAVASVPDPEMPAVTIGMLGMIHDITVVAGQAHVELLPTISGCPATEMIAADVRSAVAGVEDVADTTVRFRYDPPWSPARISDEGHEQLRAFGIAPPTGDPVPSTLPEGARALPMLGGPSAAGVGVRDSSAEAAPEVAATCPFCSSTQTTRESAFGPTPCRDIRYCNGCRQPFEAFKSW